MARAIKHFNLYSRAVASSSNVCCLIRPYQLPSTLSVIPWSTGTCLCAGVTHLRRNLSTRGALSKESLEPIREMKGAMAPEPDLLSFFEGKTGDFRGRKLSQILQWSDDKLEVSHDYIQTAFPLPEASGVNWGAPIVDRRVFYAFRSRPELRESLHKAFTRMLSFYGFKWNEDRVAMKIIPADNFESASHNWVHRFDHNHLRITRIIRSLRVLGLEDEALAFFGAFKLVQQASNISSKSLMFWTRAAQRPLNIAPEVDEEDEEDLQGPAFLREFEEKRREQRDVERDGAENNVGQTDCKTDGDATHENDELDSSAQRNGHV